MSILERINSSNDIKKLPEEELEPLCQELRDYMISSISRTGGHLASNLGAVELTVALHRVYDTSRDRVVFDVGHQSYVHKIITAGGTASVPSVSTAASPASRSRMRARTTLSSRGTRQTQYPSLSAWRAPEP